MRVPRIYQNVPLSAGPPISLDEESSKRLSQVLRLEKGHKLILFNGDGNEYPAHIVEIKRHHMQVQIETCLEKSMESSLKLHLGQVIAKGERMDYAIQKATELGISEITPLFSTRCEVHLKNNRQEKKLEHWQKVIINSCEQCGRNQLPQLNPAIELHPWLENLKTQTKLLLDHRSEASLKEVKLSSEIALLVGPEGGLTFEEKNYALHHGFQAVQLGPRVFRSETAGLVAISVLQWLSGDLGGRVSL